MQLKIKTAVIELEYTDEYSIIEESAKRRILEIINQIHTHRVDSKPAPTVSAYDVFGELKTNNI